MGKLETEKELIYKDLSYKVVGVLFEVYNRLGFGCQEKIYQRALAEGLKKANIPFKRENYARIRFKGKIVGGYFHDFLIEGKLVLELKVGTGIYENNVNQLLAYLKDSGKRLGILVVFTQKGVVCRRVVN